MGISKANVYLLSFSDQPLNATFRVDLWDFPIFCTSPKKFRFFFSSLDFALLCHWTSINKNQTIFRVTMNHSGFCCLAYQKIAFLKCFFDCLCSKSWRTMSKFNSVYFVNFYPLGNSVIKVKKNNCMLSENLLWGKLYKLYMYLCFCISFCKTNSLQSQEKVLNEYTPFWGKEFSTHLLLVFHTRYRMKPNSSPANCLSSNSEITLVVSWKVQSWIGP